MSINYLDKTGLAYFWDKIKAAFVKKEAGKGLSTNDYTTAEKTKLAGIEAGANNYALPTASGSVKGGIKVGSHLSVDENGVLSAEAEATDAMVINASVSQFSDGETVTIESLAIAELEQAAEDGRSVFLRLSMEGTHDTRILPLYRVVKSVISSGSTTPVDRYTFGFATDKTTMKLLISVDGENYTAEPLYLKTLSASELNALPSSEKGEANGVCPLGADSLIAEAYIPDVYVRKVSGKGLSSNDYTSAEKSKLASMPAAADIVQKTEKGEANGVCPLNAYGVIPGEYIPGGGDEDRYVVNVKVDVYGHLRTDIPAADADELMEIAQHEFPELRLVVSDVIFYKAFLAAKYPAHCVFTFLNGKKLLVYNVNTTNGTISITSEFTFITEEA